MIRDAQLGLIDAIRSNLLYRDAPVAEHIWESSRVFVRDLVEASKRERVQMQPIREMVISVRECGAGSIVGIIPVHSPRLARRVGLDCVPAGPVIDFGGYRSICVDISMATKMH